MTLQLTKQLVFVGISTTGPDVFRHGIFEVALSIPEVPEYDEDELAEAAGETLPEIEWEQRHFWLAVDLTTADAETLRSTKYHERHPHGYGSDHRLTHDRENEISGIEGAASTIARLTAGRRLVAIDVASVELFLRGLLVSNAQCPLWSGLIDIDSLALGAEAAKGRPDHPIMDTVLLARCLDVKVGNLGYADDRVALARDIYAAVVGE
jgi:hypothetical protein